MKKTLSIILSSLLLLLSSLTAVSAEDSENVTRRRPDRDEVKVEIQEVRSDRQENRQERQEERQENRQEIRSNIASNHAERLENRFMLYSKRLGNIIERFQVRLDTIKADGKDTSNVQSLLTNAKTKLGEATTKGNGAIAAFRAIDPAKFAEQKTQVLAARDLANQARRLFVEVHQLLKSALIELKEVK